MKAWLDFWLVLWGSSPQFSSGSLCTAALIEKTKTNGQKPTAKSRPSVSILLVHLCQHRPSVAEAAEILGDQLVMALPQALSYAGGVRSDQNVVERPQRRIFRQRLLFENVKSGTGNTAFCQKLNKGRLVEQRPPPNVDQVRMWLDHGK